MLCAGVILAFAVTISGCSGGSPPSQVPIEVTGFVKTLVGSNPVVGADVTISGKTAATDVDGKFVIAGVPAPQNGVTVTVDLSSPPTTPINQKLASTTPVKVDIGTGVDKKYTLPSDILTVTDAPGGTPGGGI
jgi:hypothetical protein